VIFKDVDLRKLLQMMEEFDVAEITLKHGWTAVGVKRHGDTVATYTPQHGSRKADSGMDAGSSRRAAEAVSPEISEEASAEASIPPKGDDKDHFVVKAPLVGTFYCASSPGADPFVEVGDRVKNGDILCIIEAMKNMNEIHSDVDGVIKDICATNAELVEFEQPLFKIDVSS